MRSTIVSCPWNVAVIAVSLSVMAVGPVSAQRIMTTAAGTDWFLSADGKRGPDVALSSSFRHLAVDAQGNIYVADPLNEVVLKMGMDGIVHVVAGNGIAGF